jgi:hypothetical protein
MMIVNNEIIQNGEILIIVNAKNYAECLDFSRIDWDRYTAKLIAETEAYLSEDDEDEEDEEDESEEESPRPRSKDPQKTQQKPQPAPEPDYWANMDRYLDLRFDGD